MPFNSSIIKERFRSPEFSIFVILLFHVSGFIGLQTSSKEWFLALTPLNLLISLIMLMRHESSTYFPIFIYSFLIYLLGYILEVLGVNTGLIFGYYIYGPVLGYKVWNTPVLIGVNWLIMIFCTRVIMERWSVHFFVKSLLGAFIMTLIDYIIEPVAIYYNFWRWEGGVIPIQNYLAWFLFSFLFLLIFYQFKMNKTNKVAPWLLMTQVIFFLLLNLLI